MKERQMRGPRDEAGDLWEGDVQTGAGRVLGGTGRSLRGDAVSIGTDGFIRNCKEGPRPRQIATAPQMENAVGVSGEKGTHFAMCVSDQAAEALGEAGMSTGAMRWQTTQDKESDMLAQTVMAGERMPGTAVCNSDVQGRAPSPKAPATRPSKARPSRARYRAFRA